MWASLGRPSALDVQEEAMLSQDNVSEGWE